MTAVLWDLNGTLVHNNKSLGTGDLPEGYGSDPQEAIRAFQDNKLPRAYYLTKPEDVVWIDGALEALKLLTDACIAQFIITNQEQIEMGVITYLEWIKIQMYSHFVIHKAGGKIDAWYVCPHAPGAGCMCRKRTENPGLRLFYECAVENRLNLYDTYYIGDNASDMVSGSMAGCKTIMVETPVKYDSEILKLHVDYTAENALDAAKLVLRLER